MNPFSVMTVEGDARTWHTGILAGAVADAEAAGIARDRIGGMLRAKGSELQLDVRTAVHDGAPREERMGSLWAASRHRYHDDDDRTASQAARTREHIGRWAFNERRAQALGGPFREIPEDRWAIHVPLVARRYKEWRGLDVPAFLYCIDDDETFKADCSHDRVTQFSCTLGDARIDATWRATVLDVPIDIPHTLDAGIIGHPVVRAVHHPVLDDPRLTVTEIHHRGGRTRLTLARAWTTLGDAP